MADQRVDQRAIRVARRRMDDEPGWLVDHDQMLVLVDHGLSWMSSPTRGESSASGASKAMRDPGVSRVEGSRATF